MIPHGIPDFPFLEPQMREGRARLQRQYRDPDVRAAFAKQGHRDHDRCDAGDPRSLPERRVRGARRDASEPRARPGRSLSREPDRARAANWASRTTSSSSTNSSIRPTLLDFISMCDVYVTPYLNEAQMTSGTLAYSFGLGQGRGVDALLARERAVGGGAGHAGAVRRCDRASAPRSPGC